MPSFNAPSLIVILMTIMFNFTFGLGAHSRRLTSYGPLLVAITMAVLLSDPSAAYPMVSTSDGSLTCAFPPMTPELWAGGMGANVTNWIAKELAADSGSNRFTRDLFHKYAPAVASSMANCNGEQTCSVGSCYNVKGDLPASERALAYYALDSISNFNNFESMLQQASEDAANYIDMMHEAFVKQFNDAERSAKLMANHAQKVKIWLHTVSLVIAIVAAAGTGGAAFAGVGVGTGAAAIGAAAAGAAGAAGAAASSGFTKLWNDYSGMINAVIGGTNGLFGSTNGLALDFKNPDNLVHSTEVSLANFMATATHHVHDSIKNMTLSYLNGNSSPTGQNLASIVESGLFIIPDVMDSRLAEQAFVRYWTAIELNYAWTMDRAYIVEALAPSGGCQSDNRGPPDSRVCLKEEPNYSYYVYHLPRAQERRQFKTSPVRGPQGHELLTGEPNKWSGIRLEDVVRSSLGHYCERKFQPVEEIKPGDLSSPSWVRLMNGDQLARAFTIPICRSPGGQAISKVEKHHANYPCMCGDNSWDGDGYDLKRDETPDFLEASNLFASHDWHHHCKHSQDCEAYEAHQLSFPEASELTGEKRNDKIKHPWKKCKWHKPDS